MNLKDGTSKNLGGWLIKIGLRFPAELDKYVNIPLWSFKVKQVAIIHRQYITQINFHYFKITASAT